MTAIVGIARDGVVWIGGDSRSTIGDTAITDTEPKVWRDGDFVFGIGGLGFLCSKLRHDFKPPPIKRPLRRYLATEFADAMTDALGPHDGTGYELALLVGVSGVLYVFDSSLAPLDVGKYYAVGSGGEHADGVLDDRHSADPKCDPVEACLASLRTAARRHVSVGPPYHLVCTDWDRRKRFAK